MSFFASGLGVGKSSFFGLPRAESVDQSSNRAAERSGSSNEIKFRYLATSSSDSGVLKSESNYDEDADNLSNEDMEVVNYAKGVADVEEMESREDADPTGSILQQDEQEFSPAEDNSLEIDTSHDITAAAPADVTKTPEVVKRNLEPNAEPPCTEEGTAAKRHKMSAPKLFRPSLKVGSPSSRPARNNDITSSSDSWRFDLNSTFHSPLKKMSKPLQEAMPSETKQKSRENFSPVEKDTGPTIVRPPMEQSARRHPKGTGRAEVSSVASTGGDNSDMNTTMSTFGADAEEENIAFDDISTTREYLNRVSGLLESGNMQLNESIEMLEKASMDLAIQKHRLLQEDCVLSSVLKLTVGMKKLESLRKRIKEMDWD